MSLISMPAHELTQLNFCNMFGVSHMIGRTEKQRKKIVPRAISCNTSCSSMVLDFKIEARICKLRIALIETSIIH